MPTHWKKLTNPDYIGAYAFEPGEEKTVTIASVGRELVTGPEGKQEECVVAHFMEPGVKPMILNSTNCKAITKLHGTAFIEEWTGKPVILCVQRVRAFGEIVDAVRVKPELPPACADCGAFILPYRTMTAAAVAGYTRKKYGRCLCSACAEKANSQLMGISREGG